MGQTFCFIGDPGERRGEWLHALRSARLQPVRIDPCSRDIEALGSNPPCAIVIGSGIVNRDGLLTELRQINELDSVPVIARLPVPDEDAVERAFAEGVDDVVIDGAVAQIDALVSNFGRTEPWRAVRAPSGLILLADEDRQVRIRLGHVLRRSGFDICFASNVREMEHLLANGNSPRAVVASAQLPGGPLTETLEQMISESRVIAPWVITNAEQADYAVETNDGQQPKIIFDNGSDAERLTFLMNELLAPAPPEGRRTPRLLYEAMATFTHEGSSDVFYGYTYNVNAGGLFVRTLTPPPKQSRVEIRFRPPCGRGEVVATAQVVWRKDFGDRGTSASPAGMGVQFVDWAPADRAGYEAGYQALLEMHGYRNSARSNVTGLATRPTMPPGTVLAESKTQIKCITVQ